MSLIHHTTLKPTKLELLTDWLPSRPWYRGGTGEPSLSKAGGFRLDDPAWEVGIEFMVAADGSTAYHVPLTYRGSPLAEIGDALIGTTEHGVLGQRWIYDGTRDPVLVRQLVALIQGEAEPQAQSQSHTPDPTVLSWPAANGPLGVAAVTASDDAEGTAVRVRTDVGELAVRIQRVLRPLTSDGAAPGAVSATWGLADGTRARGIFATASREPAA
ncbi:MAG: maltokinase N-terminal cap-like domain-containing protein [Trebonia sp.]